MKKALAIIICIILVLAVPLSTSATDSNDNQKIRNRDNPFLKEVLMEASLLPDEIIEGDTVEITFIVPKHGSAWEYGEVSGLLDLNTVFDKETGSYITTANVDTSSGESPELVFEFLMTAGKSHVVFLASYENSVEITGDSKTSNITYFWNQDFSTNADGWVTGATSGTITLDSGTAHITGGMNDVGPYSFFEGSNAEWTGDWYASIKVFLDPSTMTVGEGFNYTVAINNPSKSYLANFEFAFTSNSTSTAILADCDGSAAPIEISTAGWYTLSHYFYDNSGFLAVDLRLIAEDDTVLLTGISTTAYNISSEVGGSRYGWFTLITDDDGIYADDFQRYSIP